MYNSTTVADNNVVATPAVPAPSSPHTHSIHWPVLHRQLYILHHVIVNVELSIRPDDGEVSIRVFYDAVAVILGHPILATHFRCVVVIATGAGDYADVGIDTARPI